MPPKRTQIEDFDDEEQDYFMDIDPEGDDLPPLPPAFHRQNAMYGKEVQDLWRGELYQSLSLSMDF